MVKHDVLFETIKNTIFSIDSELKEVNNTGVFFAPELYIAFCMGRDIYINREVIFEDSNVKWRRETNLGNAGLSDIAFESRNCTVVIELKLIDTWDYYLRDIEKLKRLPSGYEKFFCVLIDKIKDDDGRLKKFAELSENEVITIGRHDFHTLYSPYKAKTYCDLNLFKVL